MKTAPKVILLLADAGGSAAAIAAALHPNPSSSLRRLEASFDLSLEKYGVKDVKASGKVAHFVDDGGVPQVSILLLQEYESPILACAVNEVFTALTGEDASSSPSLVIPFLLPSSKLKLETKKSTLNDILYGIQIGPERDTSRALLTRTQRPPSSLQIHHEPLSCVIQLVRILKMPVFIILGQSGQHLTRGTSASELEAIHEMGEILASFSSLQFIREKIEWSPAKSTREDKEPWRDLYG